MGATTVLQLPLLGGLDEKTARHYLDPSARLSSVTDGNYVKVGAVDKRLGIGHLVGGNIGPSPLPELTDGVRLASWTKSELTAMGPAGLYAYSAAEGGLAGIGPLPPCKVVRRPIATAPPEFAGTFGNTGAITPNLVDFPFGGSTLRLAAYQGPVSASGFSTIYATVWDANTGDVILAPSLLYTGSGAPGLLSGCVVVQTMYLPTAPTGHQVVIAWLDENVSATSQLLACNYNPATNSISAPTTILGAGSLGTFSLDLVPFSGDPNGGMILLYPSQRIGNQQLSFKYLSPTFTTILSGGVDSAPGSDTFAADMYVLGTYNDSVWFFYAYVGSSWIGKWVNFTADGTFVHSAGPNTLVTTSSAQLIPPATMGTGLAFTGYLLNTTLQSPNLVGGGITAVSSFVGEWVTLSISSGAPVDSGAWPFGMHPSSRGFMVGTTLYQPAELALCAPTSSGATTPTSLQGTLFLLQLQTDTSLTYRLIPVATVAPRQKMISAQPITTATQIKLSSPLCSATNGTRFAVGLRTLGVDTAAVSGSVGSTWAADFYFDAASQGTLFQANELGQELHIAAASPFIFDGSKVFEDSFFFYPEFSYASQSGSGSSLSGTYTYAVVYTYPDAAGLLHRSAPVFTNAITLSGGQNPQCNITTLSATWRDFTGAINATGNVYAELYRTLSTPATPVFYFVDRVAITNVNPPYLTYTDTTPDAAISVSSILYTTGGVLDNPCPPSLAFQVVHKGRLWGVDETLRVIWFTQAFSSGLAPSWNELMTILVPDGGDITGLSELDDKLIVWKSSSIWVIYGGDGLTITGQGSDITNPQRVASDVGAISWQTIVLTPVGLMFQAANGIYLLDRSMSVSFIGTNVIDTLVVYRMITSATLVPSSTQVRFTATNGAETVAIVYDYLLKQWTTHNYAQLSAPVASSCLSSAGRYSLLTSDGNLWQEHLTSDSDAYFDADSTGADHFVSTFVTLAWVKTQGVPGIQAYQRMRYVMLLADRLDDCGLQMQLAFNYDPTIQQTATWASTQLDQLSYDQVQMHVGALYNKGMALQITVSDTEGASATNGQGASFVNVAVELDAIGPRYRAVPSGGRK
jgi:hypothetical protein